MSSENVHSDAGMAADHQIVRQAQTVLRDRPTEARAADVHDLVPAACSLPPT